jgi:cytochrome P450
MTDQPTTVLYNPFEPGFTDDPYPHYRELREAEPVHETPLGFWLLFRYDDVLRFLRDPHLSVEERNAGTTPFSELAAQLLTPEQIERGNHAMLNLDAPDHTRLRKLVSKAFTPRTVESLRARVEALVDDALDRAADAGRMDVIGDLAFPLPFLVISEMLGMPDTDRVKLREWSGLVVRTLEPMNDPALMLRISQAADEMRAFLTSVIEDKRRAPADDLLSALIAAEEHGDVLSDTELLDQVMLLYIAGHETTVNLIGNGTLALLRNRDQLGRLQADPGLLPNAVEELLRYDPPVQMTRRITLQDVEVGDRTIPAGRFVALVLASANRDPAQWGETGERLDVGREGAERHLAFGGGVHYCLGAALARLEGQVALARLVERFPGIEQAGEPVWNGRINLRGLDTLPVTL